MLRFVCAMLLCVFASCVAYAGSPEENTTRAFRLKTMGQWQELTQLVTTEPLIPNARDRRGWTLLHYSNDPDLTRALIEAGADVNVKGAGIDPSLMPVRSVYAVFDPKGPMASVLAELSKKGDDFAPLHVVRDADTAKVLLEAGADPDIRDGLKRTPLSHALTDDLVKGLLEGGADVNAQSVYNSTPLMVAVDKWRILVPSDTETQKFSPVITRLVDAGADLNLQNNMGGTVLHQISNFHPTELLEYLLAKGADPKIANSWGDTPLCYAVADNSKNRILAILSKYPGVVFAKCSEDRDIIEYARAKANKKTQAFVEKAYMLIAKDLLKNQPKQ